MNILNEVITSLSKLKVPIETGAFTESAPDEYIVLTPLSDSFPINADDEPQLDKQELRITIYTKKKYLPLKNKITAILLSDYFFVTDRRYGGYDAETSYHQYTIDIEKQYEIEEE